MISWTRWAFLGTAAICGCSADPAAALATAPDGGATTSVAGEDAGSGVILPAAPGGPSAGDDGGAAPSSSGGATDAGPIAKATDAGTDASDGTALPGWTLTWSDEFNLPNGSAADSAKWTNETGNSGWDNNHEREYYTPGSDNASIQNGALVITAKSAGASAYPCAYGACEYTSARLNTSGKFSQAYGRFESRIKLPTGQGIWPAFWILGDNIGSVGWPTCGEQDIMENIGSTPSTNYGSLHGPGYSGGQDLTGSYTLPGGATLSDDFHVYAVEWAPNVVKFYFDGDNYETRTPADVPAGDTWVYDHPFFVLLNLAVGGYWPGDPDDSTTFPQTMEVDYVRVYSAAAGQ